ncbi:MAG: hypothetical protein V3S55_01635, partial [Nitrospiraceae bacterium]
GHLAPLTQRGHRIVMRLIRVTAFLALSRRLMALLAARGLSGFRRRFLTHLLPASTNVPFFRKYALLFGWKPLAHPVPTPVAPPGRNLGRACPGIGTPLGKLGASWATLIGKNGAVLIGGAKMGGVA